MNTNIYVVIMAGGSGTRFWPYSRENKPKQFLDVIGTGKSLLQMSYDRFKEITTKDKIWIVSNQKYESLIKEQLPDLQPHQILLEPEKRNTAPCIAYASYKIKERDPDALMVVSPSDHVIFNETIFNEAVQTAIASASKNETLITIGIQPNRPETGYGYIQYEKDDAAEVKKVRTFTEKPNADLADRFIKSGDFLWNSGIFVWSVRTVLHAFETHEKGLASIFARGHGRYFTKEEPSFIQTAFSQCKNISIDYAILEKATNVFVVPGDFGWSDLGSWNALYEIKEKDENENVIEANVLSYESKNNYLKGRKDKVMVLKGVEGFLVADFEDVLLICKKEDSDAFKNFLSDVKAEKGASYL